MVILLDNGHASCVRGKRSPVLEDGTRFLEYKFNRNIVKKLSECLTSEGIDFRIVTPEVDEDIPLSVRAKRANAWCDEFGSKNCLLISIHSNACGDGTCWHSAKGWSIYTTLGTTMSDKYATIFHRVACDVLSEYDLTTRQDYSDGDPDYEENFTILKKTKCPAVLTENLFFTNKKECEFLMTEDGENAITRIHLEAIKEIIKQEKTQ